MTRVLIAACGLVHLALAQAPPRGWDTYHVIMWSTGTPARF
jgi:hypothetical protein